jgi:DNA-binding Lrp family transcriptional regulator
MSSRIQRSTGLADPSSVEELDIKIIRTLQGDARSSYRDIARKIGVAVGTVQSRLKKLEESKIIRGFSVDVDYSRMGLGLTALILLQVMGKHLREVESKLANLTNVCIVYDITGDFDVALVAKFSTSSAMDKFIKHVLSMDYVERTSTSIVLNSVKENYNVPI